MRLLHFIVTPATLMVLWACTPALNWREVRLEADDGSTLTALLPCKPDQATRTQVLGGERLNLSMLGCSTGGDSEGTMFTLSRIPLKTAASAPQVLMAWQAAVALNLGEGSAKRDQGGRGREPAGTRVAPATPVLGASAWPPAARVSITGKTASAEVLWFAKQQGAEMVLYQAALYAQQRNTQPLNAEAANTFFESLRLQ